MGHRIAIAVTTIVACHAQPPPQLPRDDAWIEIADAGFAKAHSNATKHTAYPFEFLREGVNGTQLMLQFLDTAEAKGAKYASNLAVVLQMEHDGATIECVSKIVPAGTPRPATTKLESEPGDDDAGTTMIHPWTPNLVTTDVDDHRFVCEQVAERPEASGTGGLTESAYMPEGKLLGHETNIPPGATPVTADWHDECHLESERRHVTRYEHYVASHFEPPDWAKLGHVFGGRELVELPPECHAIAKADPPKRPLQRIEADLGYSGQPPEVARKPMQERLKQQLFFNWFGVPQRGRLPD